MSTEPDTDQSTEPDTDQLPRQAEASLFDECNDSLFAQVFVFSEVIKNGTDGKDHVKRTQKSLSKLSTGNLKLLAAELGHTTEEDWDSKRITNSLLISRFGFGLQLSCAFLAQHGMPASVCDQYELCFDEQTRAEHIRRLGRGSSLAQLTKLIFLLAKEKSQLLKIFLRNLWQKKPTDAAYTAQAVFPTATAEGLLNNSAELADKFKLNDELAAKLHSAEEISPGKHVILFQRELQPRVLSDYTGQPMVFNQFGWVLFAIDLPRNEIQFKRGGAESYQSVLQFLESSTKLEFEPRGLSLFSAYDFETFENRVLGGYEMASGFSICSLRLNRSNHRTLTPVKVGPSKTGMSIRADLSFLKQQNAIAVRAFADIDTIGIRMADGTQFDINVLVSVNGICRLQLNDANVAESKLAEIYERFEETFGVPLETNIDPRQSKYAAARFYDYLLNISSKTQVEVFHQAEFDFLTKKKVLVEGELTQYECKKFGCNSAKYDEAGDCPTCRDPLTAKSIVTIEKDLEGVYKYVQKFFKTHTDWKLLKNGNKEFRKENLYLLQHKTDPNKRMQCCIVESKSSWLEKRMRELHQCLVVVNTNGSIGLPRHDNSSAVHFHLADLIAAGQISDSHYLTACNDALTATLAREEEQLLKAAFFAYERLNAKPADYSDQDFEKDVFALTKVVVPNAERWGGPSKPDGLCSLAFAPGADLSAVENLNWSYDAKITGKEGGYDLDKSEKRKAFEYVVAIQNQVTVQMNGKLAAHVFVSNCIDETKIKGTLEHFQEEHNAAQLKNPITIVLMTEEFLTTLYKWTSENREFFRRRELHVGMLFKSALTSTNGYKILNKREANALIEGIKTLDPIEKPVDAGKVRDGIVGKKANQ